MRAYFSSATANLPSSANLAGINSSVVDTLISYVLGASSSEELIVAGRALDRTLLWGYYLIPIIGRPQPRAVYWDKFGQPDIEAEYTTDFPHTWWWDEMRAAEASQQN